MNTEIETPKPQVYDASDIQVLEGLEAVRKRPAMYIGDVSSRGLHHLVNEVVDNSIDEAMAGYCNRIEVDINEDNSITVRDNGRGIPVDMHPKLHKPAVEVVLTVLHAGGKFNKDSYKVSGGLHGVGVSCVNALSNKLRVEVYRDGKIYAQDYEKGKPVSQLEVIGTSDHTGTVVRFLPDDTIFTTTHYQFSVLEERMRELAFLNGGLEIQLTDYRDRDEDGNPRRESFHIGIGHDDHLVVSQLGVVKRLGVILCADRDTEGGVHRLDLLILKYSVGHRLLHIQDLSSQRQDSLILGVATQLGRTTCRVSLD